MSELRNHAVHASHLHGEGWDKKKEVYFCIFFPLFLSYEIYQYSETNVMHFLFSLLRIKGLYML
jgi:hypothetical protein